MSKWRDMQKKTIVDFQKLLQKRLNKVNSLRKLAKDETTKLAKLEGIVEKLKRGENVQNRQLQTWLSADEYEQIAAEWDTQKH
jgi:hypothetical protein